MLSVIIGINGLVPSIDSIFAKNIINTVEAISQKGEEYMLEVLFPWAIIYGLWWESVNWMWRLYDYFYIRCAPLLKADVVEVFYSYIQHHNSDFFQNRMAGYITNRVTEASRGLEKVLSLFLQKVVMKSTSIIGSVATMYWVNPVFASILVTWLAVFTMISIFSSKKSVQYSSLYAGNKATLAGKIVDIFSNISAVRMFSTYRHEERVVRDTLDETVKSNLIMEWFMFRIRYIQSLSCSIMMFVMVYYLGKLRAANEVTIGDFVLIIGLCTALATEIWDLTQEIGDLFEEYGSFGQAISLIQPYLITDKKDAKALHLTEGKIEFQNVTFQYKENTNLFVDKNIVIHGKEKVGLVGYSGSGKSTFVSLISRLYDVESGGILIDGQNISDVTQESLRHNISLIPQEPILFHRTIKENIGYGSNASDEEIFEAAKKAHIHDVIIALPEGYNTLCGERGNNLSGGQRQRIIIARAILKNSPILILDEATSALDTLTERYIQESMKFLMENRTVLVIAHRLSTLLDMDRILVFDNGKIVEDSSHKELLKQKGLYWKLWNSQVEGFLKDQ